MVKLMMGHRVDQRETMSSILFWLCMLGMKKKKYSLNLMDFMKGTHQRSSSIFLNFAPISSI